MWHGRQLVAEIPGAREELDRLYDELRRYLRELAEHLTPGHALDLFGPVRSIVDWHEPLLYRSAATSRVELPVAHQDGSLVGRAAEWLTAEGFEVTRETSQDAGNAAYTVVATKDGLELRIRLAEGRSQVLYMGETPRMALYSPEVFVPPEPVMTAETLSPGAVLCYECDGLGWCHCCHGRGWVSDEEKGRKRCRQCFDDRVCPICRGAGERWIGDLHDFELGYYPELQDKSSR